MDLLSNINMPFGVIFILALLWVVGIGALIVRKNKLGPNHLRSQVLNGAYEPWNGSTSSGMIVNSFDSDAARQLDLTANINDDFLESLRDDDYQRNNR